MKKTIVYVLSCDFSGSHFLSLLLGSHSRASHIGEVKGLRKRKHSPGKRLCFLCKDESVCPLYRGITPENIEDVYEILFSNLGPEISVLVDISKVTFWAERFLDDDRYEKKYIHLIRDPRALVRRWLITEPREKWRKRLKIVRRYPQRALSILRSETSTVYMYRWLAQNQEISDFLSKNTLDAFLMTYRDLARNTENEIRKAVEWMGLSYEPSQLEYWNFEHHGSQKAAYEWVKKDKTGYFDLRWKSFLSEDVQEKILNHDLVNRYLSGIGLGFSDEGLVHAGSSRSNAQFSK